MVRVVERKLADLEKYPNNPRQIMREGFEDLKQSIRDNPEFFKARPLILSDRTGTLVILAGNQKYEAARAVGLRTVPTVLLSGLTEAQEREIVVRDNTHMGRWDFDTLEQQWADLPLKTWGVDARPWEDSTMPGQGPWQVQAGPPSRVTLCPNCGKDVRVDAEGKAVKA